MTKTLRGVVSTASLFVLAAMAAAQQTITIPNGTASFDPLGTPGNAIINVNATASFTLSDRVDVISGALTEVATATFVSEAQVQITSSRWPGDTATIQFDPTGGFTGTFNLTPGEIGMVGSLVGKAVEPGDVLTFEFFESFDDAAGANDAIWNNLVFGLKNYVAPPAVFEPFDAGPDGFIGGGNILFGNTGGEVMTFPSGDWFALNASPSVGSTGWFNNNAVFATHQGLGQLNANFNACTGTGLIDSWMMSPVLTFAAGDQVTFYTRTTATSPFPDRLLFKISTNGNSTNPADFTNTLVAVNNDLTVGGYPGGWTQFTATMPAFTGRFAFNYNVTDGGPTGANSNFIGIDTVDIIRSAPATVSGIVSLQDFGGTVAGRSISVEFVGGSTVSATLDASGNWSVPAPAAGTYDVRIKASHWLSDLVNGVVVTGSGATGVNASLINGDVDGDNEVGPGDFGGLATAFLSVDGDPNWNAEADLDGDGEVGPGDFGILANNFLLSGE